MRKTNTKIVVGVLLIVIILVAIGYAVITKKSLNLNGKAQSEVEQQRKTTTKEAYLPTGFVKVEGTTLDSGYTIQDSKGNQYVWIEVPKIEEVYPTAGLKITEFTDGEYTKIENDLLTYTDDYREDRFGKDEYYSDATTGLTSTQYYELKKKMLKSVYQNEGFYIGKYETGIEDVPKTSGSSSIAPTETPVIKQNAYPYNYVTCSQAQALASNIESGNYTSSLMFGVQWDLVLKYLEEKGTAQDDLKYNTKNWGNYVGSTWNIANTNLKYYEKRWMRATEKNKDSGIRILLSTGASDTFSKQGIYDLAGNVEEWTLEQSKSTNCISRGGACRYIYDSISASARFTSRASSYSEYNGFRIALF